MTPQPLVRILLLAAFSCAGVLCGQDAAPEAAAVVSEKQAPPAEFLDALGKTSRARWRLYFRPPPPTPPVDRSKAALILGSLIAESHLIWQASDAQQFRNNNQDLITYCRMIGVGTEIMPRLMAQGKMAEEEKWKELRVEISLTHDELQRELREMKDEDLARLVDTGMWLRLLEVSSSIGAEVPTEIAPDVYLTSQSAAKELRGYLSSVSPELMGEAKHLQQLRTMLDGFTKPGDKASDSIHMMMQSLLEK